MWLCTLLCGHGALPCAGCPLLIGLALRVSPRPPNCPLGLTSLGTGTIGGTRLQTISQRREVLKRLVSCIALQLFFVREPPRAR